MTIERILDIIEGNEYESVKKCGRFCYAVQTNNGGVIRLQYSAYLDFTSSLFFSVLTSNIKEMFVVKLFVPDKEECVKTFRVCESHDEEAFKRIDEAYKKLEQEVKAKEDEGISKFF